MFKTPKKKCYNKSYVSISCILTICIIHNQTGYPYNSFSGRQCKKVNMCTWSDNKVGELIAVKVLHTSLLNTTEVTFKVLPLESYAPMPAPSPPFKTILDLVLWNGLQSCSCLTPDVIKMPFFQYFLYFGEQKKSTSVSFTNNFNVINLQSTPKNIK